MSVLLKVEKLRIFSLPPISFSLEKGGCLAVRGSSGIGKSFMLKSIADLVAPDGEIFFRGAECQTIAATQWRQNIRYIAAQTFWWDDYVYQHFEQPEAAQRLMPDYGLKTSLMAQNISTLSTGQSQRLGLLRGMADNPPILLLDEPTASLDAENRALIEQVLRRALGQGTAICMVTHNDGQAKRLAQQVLRLEADKITLTDLEHISVSQAGQVKEGAGL